MIKAVMAIFSQPILPFIIIDPPVKIANTYDEYFIMLDMHYKAWYPCEKGG